MSRPLIDCPPEPSVTAGTFFPDMITKTCTVSVITPIFGGGTKAGENDPITLIRPSSIRGHLRFWWRAIRGAAFSSVKELQQREGEIWGVSDNPSLISVTVDIVKKDTPTPCATYAWDQQKRGGQGDYDFVWKPPFDTPDSPLPYVLFPFQGGAPDSHTAKDPALCVRAAQFNLHLEFPKPPHVARYRNFYNERRKKVNLPFLHEADDDIATDVDLALWAWVNFGGIGARTRRGCGALHCKELAPQSVNDIAKWFTQKQLDYRQSSGATLEMSRLSNDLFISSSKPTAPVQAWAQSVKVLREFRQEGVGRKPRPQIEKPLSRSNLPGRSYWPEPETLRRLAQTRPAKHPRLTHIPDDAFPRAELGLPIIFHFQDERSGEPRDSELYPKDKTRMASPIIVRPLAVGDGSQAVPMILRLATPPLQEIELKKLHGAPTKPGAHVFNSVSIRRPELAQYCNSPMKRPEPSHLIRSSQGSALEAFLTFIQERNFIRVIK